MRLDYEVGGEMTEHGTDVRSTRRPGLPAIFAAFFWLGVTSFGGEHGGMAVQPDRPTPPLGD